MPETGLERGSAQARYGSPSRHVRPRRSIGISGIDVGTLLKLRRSPLLSREVFRLQLGLTFVGPDCRARFTGLPHDRLQSGGYS